MLSRIIEKNRFGGYTWDITLDSLFHIIINGTEKENSYVVEFKEWKWINSKVRFSFVSDKNLEATIIEAFDRVYDYFLNRDDALWTEQQRDNKLTQVLKYLNDSNFE